MASNDEFVRLIKESAKRCFSELRSANPEEKFCAFALYSDEGAMTVCPSANTDEYLKKNYEDEDDPLYYKWSTAEWKYEFWGVEFFSDIQAEIDRFHKRQHSEEDFSEFQEKLYESCVIALEQLRGEGFFKEEILVFSVTDYIDDEKEVEWIQRLNNRDEAKEFEQWIADQEE